MKTIGIVFGLVLIVGAAVGATAVAILGVDNAQAAAAELGSEVTSTVEEADAKIEEVRLNQCRKRYMKNSGCAEVFSEKVCAAEVLKACDPTNANYHGKVPEPLIAVDGG